jgi:glycosyltransferase involved in cell wall biosynthesis
MKITFITGHLCKERHALLNELALDLGEYGAEVTVLTGFPSRRISDEVRQYYLEHPVEQISENVIVRRIGSRRGEGKSLLERMIKYVFLTRQLYKEAKKIPTDAYYLYSSPPFLGYIGCKLAKIAPTLYNAQDLFPDTLVHMKNISNKNPLIAWFRHKEKQVYIKNTRIVTISEDMKNTIASAGCDSEKIDVIYNWADTINLHHVKKSENALMDELGIDKSKFIVSYAGDIGLFQGWDVILESAIILKEQNDEIQFVLIGSGSYKERLLERLEKEQITNVQVLPLQPASRLSEIYSVGDMELVPIEKGITKMALPSKTGVIMSCGSPILALVDKDSEIEKIIKDHNIGVAIEHGSAKKLADAILYCYEHKNDLDEWGKNARAFSLDNYSRKIQTKKYYDVLRKITSKG